MFTVGVREGAIMSIIDLRSRLRLHNWILVTNFVGTIAILLKLLL